MRVLRRSIVAVSGLTLVMGLAVQSASGANAQIGVQDYLFSPTPFTVVQGTALTWHNNGGPHTHTSTGDTPLGLWNTGNIAPNATSVAITFQAAGTYPYHCAIHPTLMHGIIRVPILVGPASGTTATTFTLTLTSAPASGFTYDVQRRLGTGAWATFRTGVTTATVTFTAPSMGIWGLRSRLVRTSNHAASKWSPMKKVTVS
jgi:plastocyanin